MKFGVVMVAYNNAEGIARLFESAKTYNHEVEFHLFLHSQQEDVVAACDWIATTPDKGFSYSLHYRTSGFNRGLAKSWNDGVMASFENGCECVVVANDDVVFGEGDLTTLAEWAVSHPELYMISAWGWNERLQAEGEMGYSCFALNRVAYEKLGCFDENYFPIYGEDIDFLRRAHLLGLTYECCRETRVQHGGSASLVEEDAELMAQHHLTFTRNREYHVRKWGGEYGEEVYANPFNQPELGCFIASDNRHSPYGEGFDRVDQGIVTR